MADRRGEMAWAVGLMRGLNWVRGLARASEGADWPVLPGDYVLGDPAGAIAVCTLMDDNLARAMAALAGVAIAGRLATANLGVERIVVNVTANPRIRFLLLCGRDSPLFRQGQTLRALFAAGLAPDGRIAGADGYVPVLAGSVAPRVDRLRRQVELVDCLGEADVTVLAERVRSLAERNPGPWSIEPGDGGDAGEGAVVTPGFRPIKLDAKREPIAYDPQGYFVISLDRARDEIVVLHYQSDNTPAHVIRRRGGQPVLLSLIRAGLVSQLGHAGYLGAELAKAEAALRLGLRYEQDRPLRRMAA